MLVALGTTQVGNALLAGNLQAEAANDGFPPGLYANGRLAFFLKGKILGKYLITSTYDSDRRYQDRLFQALDPNTFYPVYGDNSTLTREGEASGNLYLAIDSDTFHALIGDWHAGLAGPASSLDRYDKATYGLRIASTTPLGSGGTLSATALAALGNQATVRDRIRASGTAGLYYLSVNQLTSFPNLVENTDQVSLVTLDRFNPDHVLSVLPQQRGIDYTLDYRTGTLLFTRPVASTDPLGNPVYIDVTYDYWVDPFLQPDLNRRIVGGRLQTTWNGFELGANLVQESRTPTDYSLGGLDMSWTPLPGVTWQNEIAHSDADALPDSNVSFDGGLTYASVQATGSPLVGNAYRSQLAGTAGNTEFGAVYQLSEPGFTNSYFEGDTNTRRYGADAIYHLSPQLQITGAEDWSDQFTPSTVVNRSLGALQWTSPDTQPGLLNQLVLPVALPSEQATASVTRKVGTSTLSLVGTSVSQQGATTTDGTLQGDYQATDRLLTDAELGLQDAAGVAAPTAGAGAQYEIIDGISALAHQSFSSTGNDSRLGLVSALGSSAQATIQYDNQYDQGSRTQGASIGLGNRWSLSKALSVDLNAQHTSNQQLSLGAQSTTIQQSNAVGTGVSYQPFDALINTLSVQYSNQDSNGSAIDQTTVNYGVKYHWGPDFTLLGSYLWSQSMDGGGGVAGADFDRLVGIAYRPVEFDWIHALVKYEGIRHLAPLVTSDYVDTTSEVLSAQTVFQLTAPLSLMEEYAIKRNISSLNVPAVDQQTITDLWINRLQYQIGEQWYGAGEYRIMHQYQAEDAKSGYSLEAGYRLGGNVWLALGYNFVGYEDSTTPGNDYQAAGPYVRLTGTY